MAVYTPHTLVTFGGVLNTAAADKEIWQNGVRVTSVGGGPLGDHDAYLLDIAGPLAAWFTSVAEPKFPNSATLNWVKANPIGANGLYSDPAPHLHDYSPAQAGAHDNTFDIPDIMCMAISWSTALAVRKHTYATHGRIYPPNYAGWTAGGLMRQTDSVPPWVTKGKALLTLLAAGAGGCIPVIASPHAGEIHPITGVRVGDVLDVQRRRKSALKEAYQTAVFP